MTSDPLRVIVYGHRWLSPGEICETRQRGYYCEWCRGRDG